MPSRSTWVRAAAVLCLVAAALSREGAAALGRYDGPWPGEAEAELAAMLRRIDADETLAGRDPASRRTKALVVQGAVNFFRPFPGGNGRACATCHDPRDGFSLSPARVEADRKSTR